MAINIRVYLVIEFFICQRERISWEGVNWQDLRYRTVEQPDTYSCEVVDVLHCTSEMRKIYRFIVPMLACMDFVETFFKVIQEFLEIREALLTWFIIGKTQKLLHGRGYELVEGEQ
jgi:hypothetical protein